MRASAQLASHQDILPEPRSYLTENISQDDQPGPAAKRRPQPRPVLRNSTGASDTPVSQTASGSLNTQVGPTVTVQAGPAAMVQAAAAAAIPLQTAGVSGMPVHIIPRIGFIPADLPESDTIAPARRSSRRRGGTETTEVDEDLRQAPKPKKKSRKRPVNAQ